MNSSLPLLSCNSSRAETCGVEPQSPALTVFLSLVFLGGILLNSFSLWIFCFRMPQWSSGTILQFHLALSDAIGTPAAPFLAAYFSLGSTWPFGQFLCQLMVIFLSTHLYGSIFFLMLISVHRYVAVVHFSKSSPIRRRGFVKKLCLGVWLALLALGLTFFGFLKTSQVGNHTLCLSIHQGELTGAYFAVNFVLLVPGFLVPFGVSATCYGLLLCSLSKMNTINQKAWAVKAKSLRMIAGSVAIFAVCFVPLQVARTVGVVLKNFFPDRCSLLQWTEVAYYASWVLAGANCCLDPVLYCFGSRKFTQTFRSSLRRVGVRFRDGAAEPEEGESASQSVTSGGTASARAP
nr:PREDICTED: P2Y purinoceptor 4-like [Lepisosteus oculatus]